MISLKITAIMFFELVEIFNGAFWVRSESNNLACDILKWETKIDRPELFFVAAPK